MVRTPVARGGGVFRRAWRPPHRRLAPLSVTGAASTFTLPLLPARARLPHPRQKPDPTWHARRALRRLPIPPVTPAASVVSPAPSHPRLRFPAAWPASHETLYYARRGRRIVRPRPEPKRATVNGAASVSAALKYDVAISDAAKYGLEISDALQSGESPLAYDIGDIAVLSAAFTTTSAV